MKKVTYLLAAFALATSATMTSCVDNNESAAVEQIRTAKAKQLEALASMQKAMGDAELISANAAMVIAQAEAELKKAQAAVALAEAELKKTENEKNKVELEKAKLGLDSLKAKSELEIKAAVARLEAEVLRSQEALEDAILAFKKHQDGAVNAYLESLLVLYSEAIKDYQGKCTALVTAKNDLFKAMTTLESVTVPAVGNPGEPGYVPEYTYTKGLEALKRLKAREINEQNRVIVVEEATIETLKSLPQTSIEQAKIELANAQALETTEKEVVKEAKNMLGVLDQKISEEQDMLGTDIYNYEMTYLVNNPVKVYKKDHGTAGTTWSPTFIFAAQSTPVDIYPDGTNQVELVTVAGKAFLRAKTEKISIYKYTVDQQVLTYAKDQASMYIADLKIDITALTKQYGENVADEVKKRELLAKGAVTTDTKYAAFVSADKANTAAQAALTAAYETLNKAITENNRIQNDSAATQAQKDAAAAAVTAAQAGVNTAQADVTLKIAALTKAINELNSASGDISNARDAFQTAVYTTVRTLTDLNDKNTKLAEVELEKAKIEKYISLSTETKFEDAYKTKCAAAILLNDEWVKVDMKHALAVANQSIYNGRVRVLKTYIAGAEGGENAGTDAIPIYSIEKQIQICEDKIATAKYLRDNMTEINNQADFVEHLNEKIANLEVEVVAYKAKADALKVKIDAEMAKK